MAPISGAAAHGDFISTGEPGQLKRAYSPPAADAAPQNHTSASPHGKPNPSIFRMAERSDRTRSRSPPLMTRLLELDALKLSILQVLKYVAGRVKRGGR